MKVHSTVRPYQGGFVFSTPSLSSSRSVHVGGLRGEVSGFSSASRRRLRESLLTLRPSSSGYYRFALTFTISSEIDNQERDISYNLSFVRFCRCFRYNLPSSSFIWRHELQKNKNPHCHAVCYVSASDLPRFRPFSLWFNALSPDLSVRPVAQFLYGVNIQPIFDDFGFYRYIAEHTGKAKQDQLGYKGRQWGIVGRCNLVQRDPMSNWCFLDPAADFFFRRHITKYQRHLVRKDCVFGYKHKKRRFKLSRVNYTSFACVDRLICYIRSAFGRRSVVLYPVMVRYIQFCDYFQNVPRGTKKNIKKIQMSY